MRIFMNSSGRVDNPKPNQQAGRRVEAEEKAFATLVSLQPSVSQWLRRLFEAKVKNEATSMAPGLEYNSYEAKWPRFAPRPLLNSTRS